MSDPRKQIPPQREEPERPRETTEEATQPGEERGERVETGRGIARGGHAEGDVPGATGDDAHDPRAGRTPPGGG